MPGSPTPHDVKAELRALSELGLTQRFYEVIDDHVFACTRGEVAEVRDSKLALKLLAAWKANPSGDVTYDEWDYYLGGAHIFIPKAKPPRGRIHLPRLGDKSYATLGGRLYADPDGPKIFDSVREAYDAARRYEFLFTISG